MVRVVEREQLLAGLDALRDGQGGVVALVGDPGMGKTRLLSGLVTEAADRGLSTVLGRCARDREDMALHTVSRLLSGLAGTRPADEAVAGEVAAAEQVIAGIRRRLRTNAGAAAGVDRVELFRRIRAVLTSCAADGVVVVLDDVHWSDECAIELIEDLVRWPITGALLLVVAYRPRQAPPRLLGTLAHSAEFATVRQIQLGPLTHQQSAELVGLHHHDPRVDEVRTLGDGNPLYMHALVTDIVAPGPGDDPDFPLVARFLDEFATLRPPESTVMEAAVALGDEVGVETLAAVVAMPLDETRRAVGRLVQCDLLRPADGTSVLTFRNPVVRGRLHANLPAERRARLHQRILEVLRRRRSPARELAPHIEGAMLGGDAHEADVSVLISAAEDELYADPVTAARLLRAALRALTAEQRRLRTDLLLSLARALGLAGQLVQSRDLLHQVIDDRPPEPVRLVAVSGCAMVETLLGHYPQAQGMVAQELPAALAGTSPEAAELLVAHAVLELLGNRMPAPHSLRVAADLAREHGQHAVEAGALAARALTGAIHGRQADAVAALDRSVAIVDGLVDSVVAAHPSHVFLVGWAELVSCRFADAERHLGRTLGVLSRAGQRHLQPLLLLGIGIVYHSTGRLADAHHAIGRATEAAQLIGARHVHEAAMAMRLHTMSWRTPADSAASAAIGAESLAVLRNKQARGELGGMVSLVTALYMSCEAKQSVTLLMEMGGGPRLPNISPALRPRCLELVARSARHIWDENIEVWLPDGDDTDAGTPDQLAYLTAARAHRHSSDGEHDVALEFYERAAAVFAATGMVLEQARLLTEAAWSAAMCGRTADAADRLALAEDIALHCGATKLVEIVHRRQEDLATAVPAEQGRLAFDKRIETLTNREREIADAVATGRKTREIAAQLAVSPRTIDAHLTKIYRKLGIGSRTVLARMMASTERVT